VTILATAALRISEVSELRVGDVDLDRGLLQLSRKPYRGRGGPVTKQTGQACAQQCRVRRDGPGCRGAEVSVVVRPVVTPVTVVVRPVVTPVTVVVRPVVTPVTAVVRPVVTPVTAVVRTVITAVTAVVRTVITPVTSRGHTVVAAAVMTGAVVGAVTGNGAGRDENEQGGRAAGGEGASDVHGVPPGIGLSVAPSLASTGYDPVVDLGANTDVQRPSRVCRSVHVQVAASVTSRGEGLRTVLVPWSG
jgi:hypothetical protein